MSHTQTYIESLQSKYSKENATEHTYRAPMENYLHALLKDVEATNEAKRQACGMPDFVLTKTRKGQPIDIGYIEAKDIGVSLDKVEKSDQMKRYLASLDNLILTDYMEFRFFREQKKVATISIAELDGASIKALPENFTHLETLLHDFVEYTGQTIKSARVLAEMMARKAQLMRNVFEKALDDKAQRSNLHDQLNAFRQILIHDMDEAQFADVYAQTIAYGLFTARLHDPTLETFSRQEALELIPLSNPFLRKLFQYVSLELDHRVVWIVDALCEVFRAANVHDILHSFGRQSGRNDPIVHFYEDFLAAYDTKLRKARGVWYTPEPVVNFIVRAVDEVLQTHFGLSQGLADTSKVTIEVEDHAFDKRTKTGKAKKKMDVHKVQLLDVAAGTGTFTAEAIKQIHAKFAGMEGMWSSYVEEHLLPRLHGFEILMASYAMCHLKIDLLLGELGYQPSNANYPPRLNVYLTNALEEHHPETGTLFAQWLAQEANEANRIKRDMPIMVAYGNPPYSVSSQNKGEWIQSLIADYKTGLNERKINLDDDYIKFIRYAEHYIEKTGYGIVAMITNNSYLDGVTHRQMRKHLLETFDHIYIVDLHGSAKKKETAPDGSPDQNVFDIMQGVGIAIMVKDGSRKGKLANVWHQDYWGSRKIKYEQLWQESPNQKTFTKLEYKEPYYFFVPKDFEAEKAYRKGFVITDLITEYNSGIQTKRDNLTIAFNSAEAENVKCDVKEMEASLLKNKYKLPADGRDWQIAWAKEDLINNNANLVSIDYRPFDVRRSFYTGKSKGFHAYPRHKTMHHLLADNIALTLVRQLSVNFYAHIFCCNTVTDLNSVSINSKEQTYCFPLYLYPDESDAQGSLCDAASDGKRKPNLDESIIAAIAKKLGIPFVPDHEDKEVDDHSQFSPLDVLDYIYAVLHSPTYRETYKEFLKIDFPRVPYPADAKTFWQLTALGSELRAFHLLEAPSLAQTPTTFPESGDNTVGKPIFQDGRVYINETQYFGNVPEVAWIFYIGGYQPAQKWLKDRKGRELTFEDVNHYRRVIMALSETNRLMKEIDEVWKP